MNQHQEPIPFLRQVALHYLNAPSLSKRTIIFPSKRAEKFFLHHLAELAKDVDKPFFAPRTTTINDFILSQKPEYQVLDKTELLFKLYECRIAMQGYTSPNEEESLEDFLFWGNIILSDFDLIDRNLVDTYQLYRNIEGLKELEDIHLDFLDEETKKYLAQYLKGFVDSSTMSEDERESYRNRFLRFWGSLYDLYQTFRDSFTPEQGCSFVYEGYIYRAVAEDSSLVEQLQERYRHEIKEEGITPLVFVGLFDLSQSEKTFFNRLKQEGLAEFFWDREVHIIHDQEHPASRILAKQIKLLGAVENSYHLQATPSSRGAYLPQEVDIYSTASTVTQVKALTQILRQSKLPNDIHTAIVLPDEQLLVPLVSSIPSEYDKLNITLGYPLNRTSVATLINRWLRLLPTNYKGSYTIPNIVNLLSLQLLTEFYPGLHTLNSALRKQSNYTLSGKWIVEQYIPHLAKGKAKNGKHDIANELLRSREVLEILLMPQENAIGFLQQLDHLLDLIATPMVARDRILNEERELECPNEDGSAGTKSSRISFDLNFLMHYQRLVRRLRALMTKYQYDFLSREGSVQLLEGLSRNLSIPFKGDPLEGLQIMGLLESRTLHFPYILYLTAQEGKLPKHKHNSSFIPHILRYAYRLPSPEYNEAVESYRFYQTIAQSRKLVLLTGQTSSTGGKSEESRYIAQLEKLYGVKVKRFSVDFQPQTHQPQAISIPKNSDPLIRERLNSWLSPDGTLSTSSDTKALSASRLRNYLQCPLRFYFADIKGLSTQEDVAELLSKADFGTILHATLAQQIYKVEPYTEISEDYLRKQFLDKGEDYIRSLVRQTYIEHFSQESYARELNNLDEYNIELITASLIPILEYDASHTPFTYIHSEVDIYNLIPIELKGTKTFVRFKGTIDRIDSYSDGINPTYLRILDYKTGNDQLAKVDTIPQLFEKPADYKAIIQVLLYCELVLTGKIPLPKGSISTSIAGSRVNILPGLYITRQIASLGKDYNPYITYQKTRLEDYNSVREEYLSELAHKLTEIFDENIPFTQCDNKEHCSFCSFKGICRR